MLNWIIDFSLRHRFLVILLATAGATLGAVALGRLDIDAFPDTTPVQVQINTVTPSLAPEEVERQVTFPIEQVLGGLPGIEQLRSVSKFGLSQVVVTFADGTNIYFARQVINERLGTVQLPSGIERPRMGPVATGLGEVFHYVVTLKGVDLLKLPPQQREERLQYLRTVHDWVIKPKLRTVRGVAEVNSWGGFEKQYQVRIDPDRLIKHGVTFDQVIEAVEKNNRNVGGGNIRRNSQMLLVHGLGRTVNEEQIRNIVVTAHDGVPIRARDVADVEVGHEIRRGAVTADGKGETVLGLGFMLMGENSHVVTRAMKKKMDEIRQTLPPDVEVQTVYDRTELVDYVIGTVRNNLFEGGLMVIAVLFLFLGSLRAAAIVALAIPLSMLFAFSGMWRFGITASLLSLGAIDFGMVVDSSVVMVENCIRHLAHGDTGKRGKLEVIRAAAVEVRKPTLFGELIIMIVYLPILTLEGIEGKLFRPMALTVIFALAGSLVMSLTLMPVLTSLLLPRRIRETDPLVVRVARWLYRPLLQLTLRPAGGVAILTSTLAALVLGVFLLRSLGTEFVPRLSEGSIVIGIVRLPGTSLEESMRYNTQMEKLLLEKFPNEVQMVWSRVGTAEVATDPMGPEETDFFITLKPRSQWREDIPTQERLMERIREEFEDLPGQKLNVVQPIEQRITEMISGAKAQVAIKLFGDDLNVLRDRANDIARELRQVRGSKDVSPETTSNQPVLQIQVKQDELARYNVSARAVLDLVESLGGRPVGEVVEGQLRFPLAIRLPENIRTSPDAIAQLPVMTPGGQQVPLERLAAVELVMGPAQISRERSQRRIMIQCNVEGRDMGSFIAEAQERIDRKVLPHLPRGRYRIEWGGEFKNMQRARQRLLIVVPVALVLIFVLLYVTYNRIGDVLLVFTGVPFASVGGVLALWMRDLELSISAGIGFIALSGVSVLNSMVLVTFIRQLRGRGMPLRQAIEEAALTRLRPVLMTALVASLGFVPMALSTGVGAEVQRPLATVVIGGVLSSTLLTLLVLPVLYQLFGPRGIPRTEAGDRASGAA